MIPSKKIILIGLIVSFFFFSDALNGQGYNHSAGIRAGFSSGIVYKGFIRNNHAGAVEALYNRNGINISVLYQVHTAPFYNKRWLIYFGGGAFSGKWEELFSLGIIATTGIEYIMRDLPLVFSLDWKPMFNIIRITGFEVLDFGLSIRYRFEL